MTQHLPSFQQYQQEFCAHLRDPLCHPRPKNAPLARMAVYKEIVFNNLFESVSACFPVAQKTLGKRAWLSLCKSFMREHSASSPMFRAIPEEFLKFLSSQTALPTYLFPLCHYEWVELLVSSMPDDVPKHKQLANIDETGNLLTDHLVFNQTMQLLNYDYAVHKISAKHHPKKPLSTQLLVYRNAEDCVKFVELNPATYRLIELLQNPETTGLKALNVIAHELKLSDAEATIQFGLNLLESLRSQGVILGTTKEDKT